MEYVNIIVLSEIVACLFLSPFADNEIRCVWLQLFSEFWNITVHLSLTFTDWPRVWVVPSAVRLASNDSLTLVIISWVTYEHHYGVVLVLGSIDKPPPPVFHGRVAYVGTGHSWKRIRGVFKLNLSWNDLKISNYGRRKVLTNTSGRGLDGAPPPRFLTYHWGGDGSGKSESRVALVSSPCSQGEVLAQDAAVDGRHRHSTGHD